MGEFEPDFSYIDSTLSEVDMKRIQDVLSDGDNDIFFINATMTGGHEAMMDPLRDHVRRIVESDSEGSI